MYGQEYIVPMEYIVSRLWIAALIEMTDRNAIEQRLTQLVQMEEECFIAGFHQTIEKE